VNQPSLKEPPASLVGFPWSAPPKALFRVCRRENHTWWFSSDGSGRFDLFHPEGTCYFATDAFAALREATRGGPVTALWVRDRELRQTKPRDPKARLAAVTRARAASFGLTSELTTVLPYDLPRRWATAFRRAGFGGIRHELRHDPRARSSGSSLFGPSDDPGWPLGRRTRLSIDALAAAGVSVLEIPSSDGLTIVS
jgi:hypothetical protein